MKLKQFKIIVGLSGFLFCGFSFAAIASVQNAEYPEIPMTTGDAYSIPYGIGGTDAGRVMCPNKVPAPDGDVNKCQGISAQAIKLQNYISSSYVNAPVCNVVVNEKKQFYPSIQDLNAEKIKGSPDACSHRDMTLFNGLICAGDVFGYGWSASESIACKAVKDAQDNAGRMWRSPYRKSINNFNDSETYSPDMDLGVLLYAVAAKDKTVLQNWWNWIHQNTPCIQEKTDIVCTHTYKMTDAWSTCIEWDFLRKGKCTKYAKGNATYGCDTYEDQKSCLLRNLPRYCLDAKCMLRPWDMRIIEEVAAYFNFKLPSQLRDYNQTLGLLLKAGLLPGSIVQFFNEKLTTSQYIAIGAANLDQGFRLHLEGVRIYLLRLINRGEAVYLDKAAHDLSRRQPENPFFSYLNDGGPEKAASKKTIDLFNKECTPQHVFEKDAHGWWAWELADKDSDRLKKSVWDCRFMAQLLYASTQ